MFSAFRLYERARHHSRRGWNATAKILLRLAIWRDPDMRIARSALKVLRTRPGEPLGRLRWVALGTTGTCNASCVHCPTGKAETSHVPRGTMPMRIYREVIDGICDLALDIEMQISFGLFGDGLVDPLVVQRSAYLKKNLSHVNLCVNTNGAAFNRKKHADLANLVDTICLHCESLNPETYNYLMYPLRFERVSSKYAEILDTFPGKVRVSVPVSQRNMGELNSIKSWFLDRGARDVVFDPISRRCSEDPTLFNELALQPYRIACEPDIFEDLIVDCDGLVLACCNDFARQEPIGDFKNSDLSAVLQDPRRREMHRKLGSKMHDDLKTCTKCYADLRTENFPFDNQNFSSLVANPGGPEQIGLAACPV